MLEQYAVNGYVDAQVARWRRRGYLPDMEPYIYNADFLPLPEAGSFSQVNATDETLGFVCFFVTYRAILTQAVALTGSRFRAAKLLMQITRSDGYALQDRPTDIQNVAGVGVRPMRLYAPFIVPPKASWETTLSNLDTAFQWNVQVAFHGAKFRLRPRGR